MASETKSGLRARGFYPVVDEIAKYNSIPGLKDFLYAAIKNLCFTYLRDKKKIVDFESAGLENLEDYFKNYSIEEETYRMIAVSVQMLPAQNVRIVTLALQGIKQRDVSRVFET